ncbi:AAA family ATPase [Terriglobus roseus]|uniref:AAA family ATPase n=1 Tax=Terriglobus roseus TaxID=392734 RepID=UPI00147A67B8|nr:AAA family ATPase [Terriglobus roseus]
MNNATYNEDGLSVVVLTVALESGGADLVEEAVHQKHWNAANSRHKHYISGARRPAFALGLKPSNQYVALVNFDQSVEQASEAARYLSQTFAGHVTVVAVAASLNPEIMLAAMRAGCSEFLSDLKSTELRELFDRLETRWINTETVEPAPQGSILSLFGTKGGVGTTTLAVHLAMFLVQCHGKRTLLIDQRRELGHVCVYLGIDGSRCLFSEVVRNFNRLDSELLSGFVGHHSSGLDILSSTDISGSGASVNGDAVARTLAFLRSEYDYVVVDGGPPVDETSVAVLEASSHLYVIASPEIGAVRDLSRYIDRLAPIDSFSEKIKVVLNRSDAQHAIHIDQIEKAVKMPVAIQLPDCYAELVRSHNLGEPISPSAKSAMAQAVVKWADSIVGSSSRIKANPKKNGLFSLLKQGLPPRVAVTRAN